MPSICTTYETITESASYVYHSQQSFEAVFSQLNKVLSGIAFDDECSAAQVYEWCSPRDCADYVLSKDLSRPFPKGECFAAFRYGSSEGYLVHIFAVFEGEITEAVCIKFLTDKAFVYRVAQVVNDALRDGLFDTATPPSECHSLG